jgi:hypothetical protein
MMTSNMNTEDHLSEHRNERRRRARGSGRKTETTLATPTQKTGKADTNPPNQKMMTSNMNTEDHLSEHRNERRRRAWGSGRKTATTNSASVGTVVPSDQAFIDAILEQCDSDQLSHPSFFDLKSTRRTQEENGELRIMHEHTLMYNDQIIFEVSTSSCCNGIEMHGQISCCSLRNGCLRVKLSEKSCNATSNNNTWESFVFPLEELVRRSGQARQDEMLYADGSPQCIGDF